MCVAAVGCPRYRVYCVEYLGHYLKWRGKRYGRKGFSEDQHLQGIRQGRLQQTRIPTALLGDPTAFVDQGEGRCILDVLPEPCSGSYGAVEHSTAWLRLVVSLLIIDHELLFSQE